MPWDSELPENNDPVDMNIVMGSKPVEMLRLNTGKPRLTLVPTAFLFAVGRNTALAYDTARVMEYGANKYAMNNWRQAGPWLKVLDSGLRHLYKMMYTNEKVDEESGISHAGHLGCNLAFLLEFIREGDGVDDRYRTKTRVGFGVGDDNLERVLELLIDWRDGGSNDNLEQATKILARWYEKEQAK